MLELGWSEILVIAIVLIVVVGPKDLPRVLRSFGRTTAKMRAMAGDFRRQFDEALREAELEDVKNLVDDVKKLDPRAEIRKHLSPLEEAGREIRSGLSEAAKPKPVAPSTPAAEPLKNGATVPVPPGPDGPPAATSAASVSEAKIAAATEPSQPAERPARPKAPKARSASTRKTPVKQVSAPVKKPSPRKKKTTGTAQ